MAKLSGTFTALVTPFHDWDVDWDSLDALVERQIASGVDGLVACGTTAESPTLTEEEHSDVVARIIKTAAGRVPVIAGTGSNCSKTQIKLSSEAAEAGADALLLVAPYYNKPSQRGLLKHFAMTAEAVDLPIMLYNIPGRCGVTIQNDTIKTLYEAHKNIVAVKHATGGVADAAALMSECDIQVTSGDDPITLPLMVLGGVGVVSVLANFAPRAVKALTDAALAGDFNKAQAAHRKMFKLANAMLSLDVNPVPVKAALAAKGLCKATYRPPLVPLDADAQKKLDRILDEYLLD